MENKTKERPKLIPLLVLGATLLSFLIICNTYGCSLLKPVQVNSQQSFTQHPPIAIRFWVQGLKTSTSSGGNIIFRVQYVSDEVLPVQIKIYNGEKTDLILKDDGVFPDQVKGDKKYATYMKEDIPKMLVKIQRLESKLATEKYLLNFTGHVGEVINAKEVVPFDRRSFLEFQEIEISALTINAVDCTTDLLKEKSLFITDIAVVEDQGRTYNVATGVGNANGVWTFGALIDNIENNTNADGLRGFLKEWVKQWVTIQIVNGQPVETRDFALDNMIQPWLQKANANPFLLVDLSTWESVWNSTPENALKINAPFKLTAIVNRIDLRGNAAYNPSLTNAGETRFIFSLINPFNGSIPINPNQSASAEQDNKGFIDWRGMNIIFEYGNPQKTRCQLKLFAQQWLDLSDPVYVFGTPATNNPYKNALQVITDQVTNANAAPSKINGSAINRIRSNEKAFATFAHLPITDSHLNWELQDWEFRQFELDATSHKLKMVPLTNTPPHTANYAPNIEEDYTSTALPVTNTNVITWIFSGHKFQVLNGNFNLPTNLLSGSGIVRREETQFFGLQSDNFATAGAYNPNNSSIPAKKIRQQLSINTCAGCHAGETKTVFTHMNALAYGETATYWLPTLDGASNILQDPNFYPWGGGDPLQSGGQNKGITDDPILGSVQNFDVHVEINHHSFFQSVSPFLTGRRFVDFDHPINGSPTWEDDERSTEAFPDNSLNGLFYVNDPSNSIADPFLPYVDDQKWGFNDLERRKNDLCIFLNLDCLQGPHLVFDLIAKIRFVPFPEGAH